MYSIELHYFFGDATRRTEKQDLDKLLKLYKNMVYM